MVQTRRQSSVAAGEVPPTPTYTPAKSRLGPKTPVASNTPTSNGRKLVAKKDWAASHGTGDRSGAWGLSGDLGKLVSVAGTLFIIVVTPVFANLM